MAHIMTTKELSQYLKLHAITICKYASRGEIPSFKIGREWRFDKDAIDAWIRGGQKEQTTKEPPQMKRVRKPRVKNKSVKYKLRKKKV